MANAQGINKTLAFKEQTDLGTAASGSGGQLLRRRTSVFTLDRDTYTNDEIVSHQMSTGATAGVRKTTGRLEGLLSPGTYPVLFSNLLRKAAAATSDITDLSLTVAASSDDWTITRGTGDFLSDGIKVLDVIRITAGDFTAGTKNKNLLVLSATATVLTVRVLNKSVLTAEGPVTSATVSVPGKKIWTPTTGHLNKYLTVEEWYSDISKSEVFEDCKVAGAEIVVPASGNVQVNFDIPGLKRTVGTSQVLSSPTAETTSGVVNAVSGVIVVNGVVTPVTGITFNVAGNIQPGEPEVGDDGISDHQKGRVAVTGQFTAKFSSTTLQAIYNSQTAVALGAVAAEDDTDDADFVGMVAPKLKLFGDAPDDGEKEVIRTYPFTAEYNGAGGAALASLQTIFSMQDSLAA